MAQVRMVTSPHRPTAVTLRWLLCLVAIGGSSPAFAERILFAGGSWAAIDFGSRCEARSHALWARQGTKPYAGFAFARGSAGQDRFYVHLSRSARLGATIVVTIGSEPFLLGGNGEWGWSRNAEQESRMLRAVRDERALRVEFRDARGRRTVDHYALRGAPTAIDSAAAACAGKSR